MSQRKMYEFIAITHPGTESCTQEEVADLISAKGVIDDGFTHFRTDSYENACRFCYKSQSIRRLLLSCTRFSAGSIDEIKTEIDKADLHGWLDDKKSFSLRCMKIGDHAFSTMEIEREIGGAIRERFNAKVDLEYPNIPLIIYIKEKSCALGIDFSGFDQSKRKFHIFLSSSSLKGTIAYALLRFANFKGKGKVLDPFMKCGSIMIEAALAATGKSPSYFNKDQFKFQEYDLGFDTAKCFREWDDETVPADKASIIGYDAQLRHVKSGQKNAKIAGVKEVVSFSRADTSWLDTKQDKASVDFMVSYPPQLSRHKSQKEIQKIYAELFYHLDFIMKPEGKVVAACIHTEDFLDAAQKYSFRIADEHEIYQGQELLRVLVLQKA